MFVCMVHVKGPTPCSPGEPRNGSVHGNNDNDLLVLKSADDTGRGLLCSLQDQSNDQYSRSQ